MLKNEVISTLAFPVWFEDEYRIHNLKIRTEEVGMVHAFLTPRPVYCDRGHYQLNIDGALRLDHQDSFPRYFMDLLRAKIETIEFLEWRLQCIAQRDHISRASWEPTPVK